MGSVTPVTHKDDLESKDSLNIDENGLLKSWNRQCSLVSNSGKWLQIVKNGPRGSFSRTTSFKIPRHLVSLDEKYLRRCLELIHISAFKSASCNLSMNLIGSKMDLPSVDNDSGSLAITSPKTVSLSSTSSSSSERSSFCCSSPSSRVTQGTLQFTMKDNKTPHFVFSLDDQKETYVASLTTNGFDRSSLDYSYLIHSKKGPQHLVGRVKVSTFFSVSSTNENIVERQFVLYNSEGNPQLQCQDGIRKNRGLSKKVIGAIKSTTRQRSISSFSRTSSVTDSCSWEPFQEPDHDLEPVSLLDNELPTNLEVSAVVVREQFLEEEEEEEGKVGGWGMKFLKKKRLVRTKHSTSIDVMIPSGIHGGPRNGGGPTSLIQRWKSGRCDCSGWDLSCPLTVFKGEVRKDENESQCNLFELFAEGISGLRIMSVCNGLYFVQFQEKLSALQSFSIALAYIHSQSQRLQPWSSKKCIEKRSFN